MVGQSSSSLDRAIRTFEAAEANLGKLERIWEQVRGIISDGLVINSSPMEYDDLRRSYSHILSHLPKIDDWKPSAEPYDLFSILQNRIDAREIDEISAIYSIEQWIEEPGTELKEYRFRFDLKRRKLIRDAVSKMFNEINVILAELKETYGNEEDYIKLNDTHEWNQLNDRVRELNTLLGSSVSRPQRWNDLLKHLSTGELGGLKDIIRHDWPTVKDSLMKSLYDQNDPIPTGIEDLSNLVAEKPSGTVVTKLNWDRLLPDEFERLIYSLISSEDGYENPDWLMHTNAPDRGRDLSVTRVLKDGLSGVIRRRVLLQCKHYLTKSITPTDVALLKDQIKLWEPPRIDVVVFATSGRFTADAVASIERHNQSDSALAIEMWPESHLENLLAKRPALIAEFQLR
ncbi:restriction endonuclease [Paenibacillus thalictri]|uniref:Restriction endonuclease n=1 Tax=Paenibacillus thalictri TaxID=2527873 RepID=A0A4Q9DGS2_9BACL|nr:restriction endonuclease [Paenibacillus thalictri]TBL69770.1 restriction endonuclease [Paenibacillus thalictri]